jgi:hypothetical protein
MPKGRSRKPPAICISTSKVINDRPLAKSLQALGHGGRGCAIPQVLMTRRNIVRSERQQEQQSHPPNSRAKVFNMMM